MMGFGLAGVGWMVFAAWRTRRGRLPDSRWFWRISTWIIPLPFIGSLMGWIVTENGRQPWVVYGQLKTEDAVSNLAPWLVVTSIIVFGLLYSTFAVVEFRLLKRYAQAGPPPLESQSSDNDDTHPVVLV